MIELGKSEALLGSHAIPTPGLLVVLGHALAGGVAETEVVLGISAPLLGGLALLLEVLGLGGFSLKPC